MNKERDFFRLDVLKRDNGKCIVCKNEAKVAHHLMERRLWKNGGYIVDNGVSLCNECHVKAEQTLISVEELRELAGIKNVVIPDHLYYGVLYDKWGNEILKNNRRLKGELFDDESVKKILEPVIYLFTDYVKYPRTFHLPWSEGLTRDDRQMENIENIKNREVVVTTKMDGENTTIYNDYIHSRSLEFIPHPSRNYIKVLQSKIGYLIPKGIRVCGENLYAKHSIFYKNLKDYFLVFSIWDGNICLNWNDTIEYIQLLGLNSVPILYKGVYDEELIKSLYKEKFEENDMEGYVIRITDSFHKKDFRKYVGKYVRKGHVGDHGFWLNKKIIVNHTKNNVWRI